MSIVTPPVMTPCHDAEIQLEQPVHEEVLRKLAQNFNYLGALKPLGSIIYVQLNQLGASAPDPNVWQLCDNSEITHPDSPLKTVGIEERRTPMLMDKFPRMANLINDNPMGGSLVFNLAHSHGGGTGLDTPGGAPELEEGDERRSRAPHGHSISSDLSSSTTIDFPAYIKYVPYMKIV